MSAYSPQDRGGFRRTRVARDGPPPGLRPSRAWAARVARPAAWALAVAAVAGVERLDAREPAGFRMLAIIGALLYAMKAVVAVEARKPRGRRRCRSVAGSASPRSGRACGRVRSPGPGGSVTGVGALWGRACCGSSSAWSWSPWPGWPGSGPRSRLLATTLLLPGLSLIVHFGVFDVLAGAWRWLGVDCQPLFRAPLRSTSLGEFWGRRWNLAFSEMTAMAVYQPLVRVPVGGRRWRPRSSARACCTSWPSASRSAQAMGCPWATSPCTGS